MITNALEIAAGVFAICLLIVVMVIVFAGEEKP